jgi:VWFA-related protein
VVYRDGREVDSATAKKKGGSAKKNPVSGLVSNGEFGPILSMVLMDAAHSQLTWSHWESGTAGEIAVFRYQVPAKQSHYDLSFNSGADHLRGGIHWLSGYHGELTLDPASGAILRLTTVADLTTQDLLLSAAITVEYGPVEIGGKAYICPIKSVALAQRPEDADPYSGPSPVIQRPLITLLNEVEFKNYHMFRGEPRILSAEEAKQAGDLQTEAEAAGGTEETEGASGTPGANGKNGAPGAAVGSQPPSTGPQRVLESLPTPRGDAGTHPVVAQDERPAAKISANPAHASSVPAVGAPNAPQIPVYKATTHEVILDVVVTRKDGDPVTGLSRQDFAIAEDGKPQTVDFFEEHRPDEKPSSALPEMPPLPPGAVSNAGPGPRGDAVNVLLLDVLNTERADQGYVHAQINEFLKKLQPGTQVAIFVLGSRLGFVQGFTSDTDELIVAMKKAGWPTRAAMAQDRSDNADDAEHIANLQAMRASPTGIAALQAAQQAVSTYSRGARAATTFEALDQIAHYLESVPGRKNLIWFAGSFPVVFFPTPAQRQAIEQNPDLPGYMDQVKRTADLFTLSKVAVYPIGAQGVTTEHVMEANADAPGGSGNVGHAGSRADSIMFPFAAEAGERADVMYAMERLAASTGGKAYFNTNGLNDAMKRAMNHGAHYYTVGYTPTNTKIDGSFRRIDVKVASEEFKLAHRLGYYADRRTGQQASPAFDPLGELLAYGLPNATGILYGVRVEPEQGQVTDSAARIGENSVLQGPLVRYDLDFTIRVSDLDFAEVADRHSGRILVGVKAYDSDGNAVNWLAQLQNIELTEGDFDEARKSGLQAHLQVDLPDRSGLHLVTAVYDLNNRHNGTLNVAIHH